MNKILADISPQLQEAPLLTSEQTIDIVKRYQEGDTSAKDVLKLYNMRFVASVAKQYLDKRISKDELIEAGTRGLLEAATRYKDDARRFRFIPYAV